MNLYWTLLICIFCLLPIAEAQESFEGQQKDILTNSIEGISYSCKSYSINNIFYNRFALFHKRKADKDTICTVDINFNRNNNTIDISQVDKFNKSTLNKTIKFNPNSNNIKEPDTKPNYCVKNYAFNDTLLSLTTDNKADILFTIADTISPLIFLHQIISIDKKKIYNLDIFTKSYLTTHLSHAINFWKWYKKDSLDKEEEKKRVIEQTKILIRLQNLRAEFEKEKSKVKVEKDSLWSLIIKNKAVMQLTDTMPSPSVQQKFSKKMDDLFNQYFSKPYNLNIKFAGNYKISVNIDNKKIITRDCVPSSIPVYYDEIFQEIYKNIEHFPLKAEEVSVCKIDPSNIIIKNHLSRINQYKKESEELKLSIDSTFSPILDSVNHEFKKKCDETLKLTTIYNYPFSYESKVENQYWIRRSKTITDSKNSVIQNQNNILQFNKVGIKLPNGKYKVQLNTIQINNHCYEPVLDSVKLKYKFMTHFGCSVGLFIPEYKNLTLDDLNLQFWNVFLIYHHVGLFYGTTLKNLDTTMSNFKNYNEFGFYLAPGRSFFFKLGLAGYNDTNAVIIRKPLVGCSLILPFFHFEGGYNFALGYPYTMVGINIPINI